MTGYMTASGTGLRTGPGVGFSLEYEWSVTQSPPWDYFDVKGVTVGQFREPSRAEAKG